MRDQSPNPEHTTVPASLSRGLELLHLLAAHPDGLRHGEIVTQSGWSKTAVSRALKHLQALDYIDHSDIDHRYRSSPCTQELTPSQPLQLLLLEAGKQVVKQLCKASGWSAALLYWTGNDVICLATQQAPGNVQLQNVGHVTRGIVDNPYHVFFLSQQQWRRFLRDRRHFMDKGLNHAWYEREQQRLKQHGFTTSNNGGKQRVAAPIYRGEHCIGALLIGHRNKRAAHKQEAAMLIESCQVINKRLS